MKPISNMAKQVLMKSFLAACIVTLLISGSAFAAELEQMILEMQDTGPYGVRYEGVSDLKAGEKSSCQPVPASKSLSNVKFLLFDTSGAIPLCTGSAVIPLEHGASGTVCRTSPPAVVSLRYGVGTNLCGGKSAWWITFWTQKL